MCETRSQLAERPNLSQLCCQLKAIVMVAVMLTVFTSNASAALQTSSTTPNSVTLTWTAPGDDGNSGVASQYDIRYSQAPITDVNFSSATQASNIPDPQAAGTTETFVTSGLSPNTTYYFAIKTADEVPNWSALSNVVSATTDPETDPPAALTNLMAGDATPSTVTLYWTSPGDDGNTGTAAEYDIRWSTSAINASNWDAASQVSGEPSPKTAGSQETFVVSGLESGTVYYFAVKTADEVPNWSALSNVTSASTADENTPPAAVASLATEGVTESSITLTWIAPGDDGSSGTASAYDIRYSTSSINGSNWSSASQVSGEPAPQASGGSETYTVIGLAENTTYYFAIKTADEIPNWSDLSNIAAGTTTDETTPPSDVVDLIAIDSDESTVTLTWTAPGDDGSAGTASQYDIRYSLSPITALSFGSATQVSGEPLPAAPGSAESFIVTDLNLSTDYYFAIKTADEVPNWSGLSNVENQATTGDQTPPAAIADLETGTLE